MDEFTTKDSGQRIDLANGMVRDTSEGKEDYTLLLDGPLFKRWAQLLTRGAQKYGKRNWCKALKANPGDAREDTKARFKESAMRHFMQWMEGDRTEDHAAAVIFNLNGYEAMLESDPAIKKLERHAQPAIVTSYKKLHDQHGNVGHVKVAQLDAEIEAGFAQRDIDGLL